MVGRGGIGVERGQRHGRGTERRTRTRGPDRAGGAPRRPPGGLQEATRRPPGRGCSTVQAVLDVLIRRQLVELFEAASGKVAGVTKHVHLKPQHRPQHRIPSPELATTSNPQAPISAQPAWRLSRMYPTARCGWRRAENTRAMDQSHVEVAGKWSRIMSKLPYQEVPSPQRRGAPGAPVAQPHALAHAIHKGHFLVAAALPELVHRIVEQAFAAKAFPQPPNETKFHILCQCACESKAGGRARAR